MGSQNESICRICSKKGYYCPEGGTKSPGIPCEPGKYSDVERAVECKLCPSGNTLDAGEMQVSEAACKVCPAGWSSHSGGETSCKPAAPSAASLHTSEGLERTFNVELRWAVDPRYELHGSYEVQASFFPSFPGPLEQHFYTGHSSDLEIDNTTGPFLSC